MADWRYFAPSFWSDPYIQTLEAKIKYLYIYLFTNEHCNQAGLYQITIKTIEFETGLTREEIEEYINKFKNDDRIEYVDNIMWVKNFLRHQPNKGLLVWKRIIKDIEKIKNHSNELLERYIKHLDTLSIPYPKDIEGVLKGYQKGIDNHIRIRKEKEKEIIKEKKIIKEKNTTITNQENNPSLKIKFDFKEGIWIGIENKDKKRWQDTYPYCDVELELKKMADWLLSNPNKKKKNYRRFITNWLSRQSADLEMKNKRGSPEYKNNIPVLYGKDTIAEFYKKKKKKIEGKDA